MHSFDIWVALGKPRFGVEFDNMKRDKLRYKLLIKEKERLSANSFSYSLNDALSSKYMDSFWKTGRSKFGSYRLPCGFCKENDIANTNTNTNTNTK